VRSQDRQQLELAWIDSPVGWLMAGASRTGLRILEFVEPHAAQPRESASTSILDQTRRELAEYFTGQRRVFTVPLEFPGTPFQERVWKGLCDIAYGQRVSYLEQSRMLGDEKAIRAVAQANGQNPIVIIIPCHRVVSADGGLGGYSSGLLRKQFLLDLERGDRLL
jgi:O-6-methylguanine DNA methyltransferase